MSKTNRTEQLLDGATPENKSERHLLETAAMLRAESGPVSAPEHLRVRLQQDPQFQPTEAENGRKRDQRRPRWLSPRVLTSVPVLAAVLLALTLFVPDASEQGLDPTSGVPSDLLAPPVRDKSASDEAGSAGNAAPAPTTPASPRSSRSKQTDGIAAEEAQRRQSDSKKSPTILPGDSYPYPVPSRSGPTRVVRMDSLIYIEERDDLAPALESVWEQLRSSGGYVETLDFRLANSEAAMTIKVPVEQTSSALSELARHGVLVEQRANFKDLTPELDKLDERLRPLQTRLSELQQLTYATNPMSSTPGPQLRGGGNAPVPESTLPPKSKKLTSAQQREQKQLQKRVQNLSEQQQQLLRRGEYATLRVILTSERPAVLRPSLLGRVQGLAEAMLPLSVLVLAVGVLVLGLRGRSKRVA